MINDLMALPYDSVSMEDIIKQNAITYYIEHPAPFKNNISIIANTPTITIPTFLTKEERKKLRRKRRKEKEQEKQDKIKLGLI
jgi:U4/U6 small nuclear ribonucleoprotein PRP3